MEHKPLTPCEFLEWDSAYFGFRIGKLRHDHLTEPVLAEAFAWCVRERIRCLYFLATASCCETVALAEKYGFRLADFRVTLDRKVEQEPPPVESVRAYREGDLETLREIASVSHRDSRFYYDPGFSREQCDELFETWIERSCTGYAQGVFVAEYEGEPAGYITCHVGEAGTGSIGLLAVAGRARGMGLGPRLVTEAIKFFGNSGCRRASVVTQGRNCAAQRLYQGCGFRTASVGIWYHRWFDPEAFDPEAIEL